MINKKNLTLLFFILFFSFYQVLSFAKDNSPQKLTVILDWFENPDHAPLFVAQEKGFFKEQGLDVTIISPADPSDPPKLVAAGKADIGITYEPQLIIDVNKGLPIVRFATLIDTPLDCLVTLQGDGITSLKDLKGKRVGYSSGTMEGMMLNTLLADAGLSEKDVEKINVHYNISQALLSRQVQLVSGAMRNFELTQFELAGAKPIAFYPEEHGIPNYDELVFVVNKKNLQDPRLAKFVNALQESVIYLLNHPQESWELFAKAHPELNNELNRRAWFDTLPRFAHHPTLFDKSQYKKLAEFLKDKGLIDNVPEISQYAVTINH